MSYRPSRDPFMRWFMLGVTILVLGLVAFSAWSLVRKYDRDADCRRAGGVPVENLCIDRDAVIP